ncbi:hypothetical protein [Phenylobacterium sp.]|uniref:hypothetical protein n=1 Tax=Phenylobacterium sp. TaxID=1871053 RepID=UPI0012116DE2|nr:hypothetical protein [Phenylobacterium sp.]THD63532.1 MAG: hypothetical protein E8A49_05140 [Phenylobacterium sp.]
MTATTQAPRAAAPWHLWVVGVVSLLWNAFGGYDYTMSQLGGGEAYLRSMKLSDAQIAALHALPVWMTSDWAIGVWGSVLGSILLLARIRWAAQAFAVSLAALLISICYYHLTANGEVIAPPPVMSAVLVAACAFFLWYAWAMGKRGVLR